MTEHTNMSSNKLPLSGISVPGRKRRYRAERNFRLIGFSAIAGSLGFLLFLLVSISYQGVGAFIKTEISFNVDPGWVTEAEGDTHALLHRIMRAAEPEISGRTKLRDYYRLVGANAEDALKAEIPALSSGPQVIWLPASDEVDIAVKEGIAQYGKGEIRRLNQQQIAWIQKFDKNGQIRKSFNIGFLINGDSRDAERAGVGGALIGTFYTLLICFSLSFFVGVMAAVYLEEFAPKNNWTVFIEVNINNLASVPSIIYGLLGLAIFLNFFGMPRSSSLVGGVVLSLMTLPTIIIASRVSLRSIPSSIREAALAIGATKVQAVFHHVVPLALPGMLTGAILGMARALGETAPLLMIGMVAFIADAPSTILDPASALPVQVYLWSDSPERAFAEKAAGAIIVLITFLVLMNLGAILLRKKFEKKW